MTNKRIAIKPYRSQTKLMLMYQVNKVERVNAWFSRGKSWTQIYLIFLIWLGLIKSTDDDDKTILGDDWWRDDYDQLVLNILIHLVRSFELFKLVTCYKFKQYRHWSTSSHD